MARIRSNFFSSTLSSDITAVATSFAIAGLSSFPTVSGSDVAYFVIDPEGPTPEIIECTAHSAANVSGTFTRGVDGTSARAWSAGTRVVQSVLESDVDASELAADAAFTVGYPPLTPFASLQTTLDGLGSFSTGDPQRVVRVRPGSYTTNAAIEVPSGVYLDLTGVKIALDSGSNCDIITNADWTGDSDITIVGGHFDGNRTGQTSAVGDGPGQSCITLVNVDRAVVRGVRGTSPYLHVVDLAVRDYHTNSYSDPGCTNFLIEDVIGTDFGDDCVTTHWSSHGKISKVHAYDNGGSYSANSGAVEIDDGSHDVVVSQVSATNCDFALNVKGHPDRGTARRVTAYGVHAENCIRGLICYGDIPFDTDGPLPGQGLQVSVHGYIAHDCPAAIQVIGYTKLDLHGPLVTDCDNLFSNEDPDPTAAVTQVVFHGGEIVATRTVLDNPYLGHQVFKGTAWREYVGSSAVTVQAVDADITFDDVNITGSYSTAALHINTAEGTVRVRGGRFRNTGGSAVRITSGGDVSLHQVEAWGNGSAGDVYVPSGSTVSRLTLLDLFCKGTKGVNIASTSVTGFARHCRVPIAATNSSSGFTVSDSILPAATFLTRGTPSHVVWADDPSWSNPGDGNRVSSWRNATGGGDPANAVSGATQPTFREFVTALNNHAGVQFVDTDSTILDYDIANISQPFTVLIAAAFDPTSAVQKVYGRGTASGGVGLTSGNAWAAHFGSAGSGGTATAAAHIMRVHVNGASSSIWVDGTQEWSGDLGAGGIGRLTLGASSSSVPAYTEFFKGHLAFLATYNSASPSGVADDLEDDLGAYYGVTMA